MLRYNMNIANCFVITICFWAVFLAVFCSFVALSY